MTPRLTPLLCTSATVFAFLASRPAAPAALQGHWKFDETAGTTAADSSGLTPANGTLVGGATFQPAAGRFGGGVYLNGTTGYVDAGDLARFEFNSTQSFSIACWYKPDGDETTAEFQTNNGLMTKGYAVSPYDTAGYYLMTVNWSTGAGNTTSFFQFDSRQSSAATTAFRYVAAYQAPDAVVSGNWRHFVAVVDRAAGQSRTYIDGALYATRVIVAGAGGGIWDMGVNSSPLVIGNHFNRLTKGWIDDAGIWNHALTPAEITSIYTNGISSGTDTDNDGLPDSWEESHWGVGNLSHPAGEDVEPDGLTNLQEYQRGTNPKIADTDGDALTDGAEVNTHNSNPLVADSDGDGLSDGAEVNTHTTNPLLADTDGDNFNDGAEITAGTDPKNAASFPPPGVFNVHINEFVSENLPRPNDPTAPVDMDGDYPDWIEIRNNEAVTVDLISYQLTDDPLVLNKWRFPSTTIPAGGHKIVFASKKNRRVNGVEPHTNFNLTSSGVLILSRADGAGGSTIVSQIGTAVANYPSQRQTFSYGRMDNTAAGALTYFSVPTPGAANSATAVSQFVTDTEFSMDRGLYSAPFTTNITCSTPGATIAYSVDGSEPTPTNGTQVPAPDSLTTPVAPVNITATTLLRARAWKAGFGSSNVDTQSYIFTAYVMTQNGPTPSMNRAPGDTLSWGTGGGTPANISAFPGLTFFGVNQAIASDAVTDNRLVESDLKVLPVLSLVTGWKGLFGPSVSGNDGGIYPPAPGVGNEGVDREASLELINPDGNPLDPNAKKGFQTTGNIHIFGGTSQQRWKSYKLQFRFQCNKDVEERVFGDDGTNRFKNFTLDPTMNNTWMHPDATGQGARSAFVRDFVMADLQNRMGQRGYHTRPAHLFLNGMYWGIYWLHEKPDHHFNAAYYGGDSDDYDVFKHSTHPNFTESDPHVNTLPSNPALPITKPTAGNPAGNSTCVNNFEALLDLLGTGNIGANPPSPIDLTVQANYDAVAGMLDIDAFIDYVLLNFVAGNQDWADKNLYAARQRVPGGKWRFFSWDAEHVFRTGTENFITGGGNEGNPLRNGNPKQIHNRLRTNEEYRLKCADRIRRHMFNGGALSVAGMTDTFNDRLDEITDAVRAESARWGHLRASARPSPFTNVAFKKSDWLTERNRLTMLESGGNSLLQNRWNLYMAAGTGQFRQAGNGPLYPGTEAPDFAQHGGSVPANYALVITSPSGGTIYHTLDGSDPRLPGGAVSGTAQTYSSPVTLTSSRTVRSRVLLGGVWSAVTEAYFSVNTVTASSASIVISEFNYNPSNATAAEIAAGFADANDFEYLELTNVGANTVDLSGCRFSAGVTYTFNNGAIRELAPGGRLIIVENAAAFAFRYGAGLPVAGEFELSTGLSNSGERITLLGAGDLMIKNFTYNDEDPWPTATDGTGHSLVLINPLSNPNHDLPENWRASAAPSNGTPATSDVVTLASWKSANGVAGDFDDLDADGYKAAIEYFLGMNPNASDRPPISAAIAPLTIGGIPANYFTFTFTHAAGRDDVNWRVEMTEDVASGWSSATTATRRVSVVTNVDGSVTEVWRSTNPATGNKAFARIAVSLP